MLCIVPEVKEVIGLPLPQDIAAAVATVDWSTLAGLGALGAGSAGGG